MRRRTRRDAVEAMNIAGRNRSSDLLGQEVCSSDERGQRGGSWGLRRVEGEGELAQSSYSGRIITTRWWIAGRKGSTGLSAAECLSTRRRLGQDMCASPSSEWSRCTLRSQSTSKGPQHLRPSLCYPRSLLLRRLDAAPCKRRPRIGYPGVCTHFPQLPSWQARMPTNGPFGAERLCSAAQDPMTGCWHISRV